MNARRSDGPAEHIGHLGAEKASAFFAESSTCMNRALFAERDHSVRFACSGIGWAEGWAR